ncbi:MAG: TlpA family protein disulfide reductase [Bacteroidota bacterium]
MTRTSMLFCIVAFPKFLFSQQKFKIELSTKLAKNTDIIFSAHRMRIGLENLYKVQINANDYIKDLSKIVKDHPFEKVAYQIKIQDTNLIEGEIECPVPYRFGYYDKEAGMPILSKKFFLEAGSYKVELTEKIKSSIINIDGATNKEYVSFIKLFSHLYTQSNGDFEFDGLTNLVEKEKIIGEYIKKPPQSYVALWEIIDDYSNYDFNLIYLENLKLFSSNVKASSVYKEFEKKLLANSVSIKGQVFPEIKLNKNESLSINDFNKSKLTLIDYWATTCASCIASMPELVSMYNEYKSKGVKFITITDEQELKRIKLANEILKRNKVIWKNYFDLNRNIFNALNINGYPTQLLVNDKGVIIGRNSGELKGIKAILDNYLQSHK